MSCLSQRKCLGSAGLTARATTLGNSIGTNRIFAGVQFSETFGMLEARALTKYYNHTPP